MERDRYRKIKTLTQRHGIKGTPVEIEKGILLIDEQTGQSILQLSFQNVSDNIIEDVAIEIMGIRGEDDPGQTAGLNYVYAGLSSIPGASFGRTKAILLGTDPIQDVRILFREVRFTDGSIWTGQPSIHVDPPAASSETTKPNQPDEAVKAPVMDPRSGQPTERTRELSQQWLCSCGFTNASDQTNCRQCGIKNDWVGVQTDQPELVPEPRIREPVPVKERRSSADFRKQWLKKLPYLIGVIALVSLATFLYIENGRKASFYDQSVRLFNNGQYGYAETAFRQLGGYKDSEDWLTRAASEPKYLEARQALDAKEYEKAAIVFAELGEYKDSSLLLSQAANEADYLEAMQLLETSDYAQAAVKFKALGAYKDSAEKALVAQKQPLYDDGLQQLASGNFAEAERLFAELGEYKDSAQKLQSAKLAIAVPKEFEEGLTLALAGKIDESLNKVTPLNPLRNNELGSNWFQAYGKALYQAGYFKEALPYFEHIQDAVDVSEFLESLPYQLAGEWRYQQMEIYFRLHDRGTVRVSAVSGDSPFGDFTYNWDLQGRNSFSTQYERWTVIELDGSQLKLDKQYVGSGGQLIEETFEMTAGDE